MATGNDLTSYGPRSRTRCSYNDGTSSSELQAEPNGSAELLHNVRGVELTTEIHSASRSRALPAAQ